MPIIPSTNEILFNLHYDTICRELEKRRNRWTLHANPSVDFDDVKQIILLHVYKKIDQWDQKRPLAPFLSTIYTNQIINLLRNYYTNLARPCVSCSANEGEDRCRIYGKQCDACPLFKHWAKGKQSAFNIKLPLSIEHHSQEVFDMPVLDSDLTAQIKCVHEVMKQNLSGVQYRIYKLLYMDGKTEDEVAAIMGYCTSERHRKAGYKQLATVNKIIKEKARALLMEDLC